MRKWSLSQIKLKTSQRRWVIQTIPLHISQKIPITHQPYDHKSMILIMSTPEEWCSNTDLNRLICRETMACMC